MNMVDDRPADIRGGQPCRYCGKPRPEGYTVTCGRSDCQEAAYHDKEKRPARGAHPRPWTRRTR